MSWTVAVGIDTHKDGHTAVALDRRGAQLDTLEVSAQTAGHRALYAWAHRLGEPAFVVEGAASYGAGLTRFLLACGCPVYEAERPRRRQRRQGKSDLIDAALAARRLLGGQRLARPRGLTGARDDLRLLLVERRSAIQARTVVLNQLQAAVVTGPDTLRARLGRLNGSQLAKHGRTLRLATNADRTLVSVLRRLAQRAHTLERELAAIDQQLTEIVETVAPQLLHEPGVGAICAAQLLVSSGDPTRMVSEASFAALAGTSPVDASSGRQQRHRLNRGGDRQLNRALHIISLSRVRHHPETAAYYHRLLATGKTPREARRCIKRTLARYFHHKLRTINTLTT